MFYSIFKIFIVSDIEIIFINIYGEIVALLISTTITFLLYTTNIIIITNIVLIF